MSKFFKFLKDCWRVVVDSVRDERSKVRYENDLRRFYFDN